MGQNSYKNVMTWALKSHLSSNLFGAFENLTVDLHYGRFGAIIMEARVKWGLTIYLFHHWLTPIVHKNKIRPQV